jgi:hypothetical protein
MGSITSWFYVIVPAVTTVGLLAQDPQPAAAPEKPTAVLAPPVPQMPPLTVRQKYFYTLNRTFGVQPSLLTVAGAGIDQINRRPDEWGSGGDAFAARVASHFGQRLVEQHLAFAIRAIDHEDPRFEPSHKKRIWDRIKFATIHTYVVRSDSGKLMPAYSRVVGDYGAAFISRQWWPERFHTVAEGFRAGSVSLALDAPYNIAREFLPDLIKKIRH